MTLTKEKQKQIKEYVYESLFHHAHLDESRVGIEISDAGEVTMTGIIDSEWAKNNAERIVRRVEKVTAVDNRLTIAPSEDEGQWRYKNRIHDDYQQKTYSDAPEIGHDPRLDQHPNPAEGYSEYRSPTPGSQFETDERPSDENLVEEIKARLAKNLPQDGETIAVEVNNGRATLNGTVKSETAKRSAADMTSHVRGIHQTVDLLRVEP